jgi:voltage-gated potassium channel
MAGRVPNELQKRLIGATAAVLIILSVGTIGYRVISSGQASWTNCVYMTVITVTTVGYGEVIDLSASPGGRIFTMALLLAGLGTVMYLLSTVTAFIIEGDLTETFRRRAMEKKAGALHDHYIVCGAGRVGLHIVHELQSTQRPFVVVEDDPIHLKAIGDAHKDLIYFDADPTDNDALIAAGIRTAVGLFAATEDDNTNLVIALSAKQMNPAVKVVARCGETKNVDKVKAAGADAVISPAFIGGLRMASEMIRPTVVSFLDVMLRDKDKNLRVEEIRAALPGRSVGELDLGQFRHTLLLAVRGANDWTYNPGPDHVLDAQSRLVIMTTPAERIAVEQHVAARASQTEVTTP